MPSSAEDPDHDPHRSPRREKRPVRRIFQRPAKAADARVHDRSWAKVGAFPFGREHRGRRLGIVGIGAIGHKVAETLDLAVAYWNRSPKALPWRAVPTLVGPACESDMVGVAVAVEGGEGIKAPVLHLGPTGCW
ncbi:NAD(P)-dependent oxidoreductase [Paracoccus beibuensis]|uniref:NAD(P)-dependent oxidoreductase n=1 Tax=Paracoccus beibuensis TaxID=547602 RepID=UPI00223EB7F1|nr:NAD(P)-dependent oxidoreductase [Paracoccus beibuensis]